MKNGRWSREANTQIISAFRATSVLDTPMRKLEVLETQDGRVIIRDTQFFVQRADVTHIYLEVHEARALVDVISHLGDQFNAEEEAEAAHTPGVCV
jgi:hypothetical protein